MAADPVSRIDLERIAAPSALDLPDITTQGLFTPGQRRAEPATVAPHVIGELPGEKTRGQSDAEFARTLFGDVAASEAGPSFGSRITDLASSAGQVVARGGQAVWRSTLAAGRQVRRGLERRHQARLRAALHPTPARPQRHRTRRSSRRARFGWQELAVATLALGGIAEVAWLTLEFTKPPEASLAATAPAAAAASLSAKTPSKSEAAKVGTSGARSVHAQVPAATPAAARSDVTVTAAIPLDIIEDGRRIASGRNPKVALPPGEHHLEFSNSALGFYDARTINVPASGAASINLAMAPGTVDVNAAPWASVQIDGKPVGDTPLGKIEVSAGSHDVLFKHPELGERTVKVVVPPGNAVRVTADLRKAR